MTGFGWFLVGKLVLVGLVFQLIFFVLVLVGLVFDFAWFKLVFVWFLLVSTGFDLYWLVFGRKIGFGRFGFATD